MLYISTDQRARPGWALSNKHESVYVDELGFGHFPHIRGHWADRLPAIDQDLHVWSKCCKIKGERFVRQAGRSESGSRCLAKTTTRQPPMSSTVYPTRFHPGQPLDIVLTSSSPEVQTVKLHYRHVNQVEAYKIETMTGTDGTWRFTIPGDLHGLGLSPDVLF